MEKGRIPCRYSRVIWIVLSIAQPIFCFTIHLIIAVQINSDPLEIVLILLAFLTAMRKFQNQVHRRAAEIAEGYFFVIQS